MIEISPFLRPFLPASTGALPPYRSQWHLPRAYLIVSPSLGLAFHFASQNLKSDATFTPPNPELLCLVDSRHFCLPRSRVTTLHTAKLSLRGVEQSLLVGGVVFYVQPNNQTFPAEPLLGTQKTEPSLCRC